VHHGDAAAHAGRAVLAASAAYRENHIGSQAFWRVPRRRPAPTSRTQQAGILHRRHRGHQDKALPEPPRAECTGGNFLVSLVSLMFLVVSLVFGSGDAPSPQGRPQCSPRRTCSSRITP
jgi:hypothetical protein